LVLRLQSRWGLIPNWAKDEKIAYKTINARVETVDTAPSHREAFKKHRCLIPVDGFYEWRKVLAGRFSTISGGSPLGRRVGVRAFGSSKAINSMIVLKSTIRAVTQLLVLNVEMSVSGSEFLKSLQDHTADCVVLDRQMPQVEGLEVRSQSPNNVWTVANYKKTLLTRVPPGEPAEIEIDALQAQRRSRHAKHSLRISTIIL
jgi:SOS response associated peptidase (SRAP)